MTAYRDHKRRFLLSLATWLREEFPPKRPVALRFRSIYDPEKHSYIRVFGYCQWSTKRRRWVITISDRIMSLQTGVDTLLHEWAHAIAPGRMGQEHHEAWAAVYGQIYRAYFDGSEEGMKRVKARARAMKKTNRARKIRRKAGRP